MGQKSGRSRDESIALVSQALDLGINYFDTSPRYAESEDLLGEALIGVSRDTYILSTKFHAGYEGTVPSAAELRTSLERSLRLLRTEMIDVLFLHSVTPARYEIAVDRLVPEMEAMRHRGLIRHIGITESPPRDPSHETLQRAVGDGHFEVVMAVYNILNQRAEDDLFPAAAAAGVGVVAMTAVRRALADPDLLASRIAEATSKGLLGDAALPAIDPLGWLIHGRVKTLQHAAYAFAAEPDDVATVLTGTANPGHLEANIAAITGPPLPAADRARLRELFGHLAEPLAE